MKSNIKRLALTIAAYGVIILLATAIFIALFHTPLFRGIGVFFYRGCILLVISSVIAAALAVLTSKLFKKLEMDAKDAMVVFFLFSGFTLGWYTLIPVTVERSISVFMLSYMDQNDTQGITSSEFGDIFYDKYIQDFGAFDKRFQEQVISGNIEETTDDNGYVITDGGRTVVNLFRVCANLFDTEKWLVYPNDYAAGVRK